MSTILFLGTIKITKVGIILLSIEKILALIGLLNPSFKNGFKLLISNSLYKLIVNIIKIIMIINENKYCVLDIVSIPLIEEYVLRIPKDVAITKTGVLERICVIIKLHIPNKIVLAIIINKIEIT